MKLKHCIIIILITLLTKAADSPNTFSSSSMNTLSSSRIESDSSITTNLLLSIINGKAKPIQPNMLRFVSYHEDPEGTMEMEQKKYIITRVGSDLSKTCSLLQDINREIQENTAPLEDQKKPLDKKSLHQRFYLKSHSLSDETARKYALFEFYQFQTDPQAPVENRQFCQKLLENASFSELVEAHKKIKTPITNESMFLEFNNRYKAFLLLQLVPKAYAKIKDDTELTLLDTYYLPDPKVVGATFQTPSDAAYPSICPPCSSCTAL